MGYVCAGHGDTKEAAQMLTGIHFRVQGVSRTVQALIQPFFSATEPPTTHTLNGEQGAADVPL